MRPSLTWEVAVDSPEPPTPLPQQIGRYRILGLLGAGGMGEVYRALDPQLDRQVALKQPRFDGPAADVRRRMERFQREARAAAGVLHPNVCPIFDVGEHEGRPFVVMALVEGQSLAQYLASHPGPLDVSTAVKLARQVLDGLAAVHARGTVHRDIKPANILLTGTREEGQGTREKNTERRSLLVPVPSSLVPVILDFGLARPETANTQLTSDGVILGTPSYMAPEQAAGHADQVGPWTDLHAVGVVLYEMLTGARPYQASGPAVLAQIMRDEPTPPRKLRPDLDVKLEAIVLRALHKDPRQRFPDARSFAEALEPWTAALAPGGATSPALPPTEAVTPPIRREPHRGYTINRLAGWVLGGVLIAAGMATLALGVLAALQVSWATLIPGTLVASFFVSLGLFGVWHETEKGYTLEGLLRGASFGNPALVRRALMNGVPPDGRDEMDETALMYAASRGHTEIVKLLLAHGAHPTLRNRFGQTAQDMARASGRSDIVALLKRAAAPSDVAVPGLPRFAPRFALAAAALAGASMMVVCMCLLDLGPVEISGAAYQQLRQHHLVKSVTVIQKDGEDEWLEGEVTTLDNPFVRQWGLTKRAFTLRVKDASEANGGGNVTAGLIVTIGKGGGEELRAPRWWQAVIMLAVPVALAVAIGRLLSPTRLLIGKD
jgi:tRNA A-37 threonylcarbamoyl transferase component Bud32